MPSSAKAATLETWHAWCIPWLDLAKTPGRRRSEPIYHRDLVGGHTDPLGLHTLFVALTVAAAVVATTVTDLGAVAAKV